MAKSCLFWATAAVAVGLGCFECPQIRAADGTGDDLLKKHGLKIVGSLAVVNEEAEIKAKLTDARHLHKQLSYSLTQQKGTLSPAEMQQTVKNVNNEIKQLKSEMSAVKQQTSRIPRARGRYSRGTFVNSDAAAMYAQLMLYQNQLQMEINQESYFLNQLKSQPADPKAREKIDSEVRDRRDAYHQAVLDLGELFDSATEKYKELKENNEVKTALVALGRRRGEKFDLGPSHDFRNNLKLFEKLERADSNSETDAPEARSARQNRHAARTKQTTKAVGAADDAGKSP